MPEVGLELLTPCLSASASQVPLITRKFFSLFCIYRRWWMLTKLIVVIISQNM